MKKLLVLLFFVLISLPAFAETEENINKWTTLDTGLQIGLVGLGMADTIQTWMALRHDPNYREMNPIIYGRPSDALLFTISFSAMIVHTIIAYILPQPWRFIWQMVWITVEFYSICNNWSIGARFQY